MNIFKYQILSAVYWYDQHEILPRKHKRKWINNQSLFSKVASCYPFTNLSVRDAQVPLTPFLDMSYLELVFLPMAQSCAPVQSTLPSNTPPKKATGSITPLQLDQTSFHPAPKNISWHTAGSSLYSTAHTQAWQSAKVSLNILFLSDLTSMCFNI